MSTPPGKFYRNITLERLDKFTSSIYFKDVNLHSVLFKTRTSSTTQLKVYVVPDLKRISFKEAKSAVYEPTNVGKPFGPSWATIWFHVITQIPNDWHGEEVQFIWDSESEAMVWSTDGLPLQGLTGGQGGDRRAEFILTNHCKSGETFEFYIEMACNGLFGNGDGGQIEPPDPNRSYVLRTAELAVVNQVARALWYDFQVIAGLAKELPSDSQRASEALVAANAIINAFWPDQPASWAEAKSIADAFLAKYKDNEASHFVTAVGHCHIDTAWLWPYDETKRKCARSWATQIDLMNRYPDFKFACSQAQQFEWVKEEYPNLFDKIKEKVVAGQFLPIGGTWVEMDCNIPSGEAFVRQFLYGQQFFQKNFGKRHDVFWLPDTFGYAAQLPQIVKESGMKYFLTQKLSWNNINKFPYNTFYWVGLDGTPVLTHFPPFDNYCSHGHAKEILFGVRNHKDKDYSNESMMLFGYGDGGGGPAADMIERLTRMKKIEGLANVEFGNPSNFFDRVENNSPDLASWHGELYFELHRGTYTSQARNKKYNRKSELLLRDIEYLHSVLLVNGLMYPKKEIDRLWKIVLLNQFHDVLPGSSIEMVYDDSTKLYADVEKSGTQLKEVAFQNLLRQCLGSMSKQFKDTPTADNVLEACLCFHGNFVRSAVAKLLQTPISLAVVNTLSFKRCEVVEVEMPDDVPVGSFAFQQCGKNRNVGLVLVDALAFGVQVVDLKQGHVPATAKNEGALFVLENEFVKVKVDVNGHVTSFYDKKNSRETIYPNALANRFRIYEDIPLFWDAWDVEVYHMEKSFDCKLGDISIFENGPLRASLIVTHPLTANSVLKQTISITASSPRLDFFTEVDWNENRRFLKVEFPLDIHSEFATYETAFGLVRRPTHFNTSWDLAKFEVCGHRFADLSEYGYGVALLNDCKYGYATHGNVMRLSLLRAPKSPDAHCDLGHHEFRYALYPHKGTFMESNVVQEGLKLNVPLLTRIIPKPTESVSCKQFFETDAPNVILDTIKISEDDPKSFIVRFYEAYGGRANVTFKTNLPITTITRVNLVEDVKDSLELRDNGCTFFIKPFQIVSLKLKLK